MKQLKQFLRKCKVRESDLHHWANVFFEEERIANVDHLRGVISSDGEFLDKHQMPAGYKYSIMEMLGLNRTIRQSTTEKKSTTKTKLCEIEGDTNRPSSTKPTKSSLPPKFTAQSRKRKAVSTTVVRTTAQSGHPQDITQISNKRCRIVASESTIDSDSDDDMCENPHEVIQHPHNHNHSFNPRTSHTAAKKRRRVSANADADSDCDVHHPAVKTIMSANRKPEQWSDLLLSSDAAAQGEAALYFIFMFYYREKPLVQEEIFDTGAAQRLFDLVKCSADEVLYANVHSRAAVTKCLVALNYIVHKGTDDHVQTVVAFGVIPVLLEKIRNTATSSSVKVEALWLCSNLATVETHRDQLMRDDVCGVLVKGYDLNARLKVQHTAMRTIRYLFSCDLEGDCDYLAPVRTLLPLLEQLLTGYDSQIVFYALTALKYIVQHEHVNILEAVFDSAVLPGTVLTLLHSPSVRVRNQALCVLEHLSCSDNCDVLLAEVSTVATVLLSVIRTNTNRLRHIVSSVRILCNFCDCGSDVLDVLIEAGVFPALVTLFWSQPSLTVLDVCSQAICFTVQDVSPAQRKVIFTGDTLELFCVAMKRLVVNYPESVVEILDAVKVLLTSAQDLIEFSRVVKLVYDLEGWNLVDDLKENVHEGVSEAAKSIDLVEMKKKFTTVQAVQQSKTTHRGAVKGRSGTEKKQST